MSVEEIKNKISFVIEQWYPSDPRKTTSVIDDLMQALGLDEPRHMARLDDDFDHGPVLAQPTAKEPTVAIKVGNYEVRYYGEQRWALSALHDLIPQARKLCFDSEGYGESWIFGEKIDVLVEWFGLQFGDTLRLGEGGKIIRTREVETYDPETDEWGRKTVEEVIADAPSD